MVRLALVPDRQDWFGVGVRVKLRFKLRRRLRYTFRLALINLISETHEGLVRVRLRVKVKSRIALK